MTLNIQQSENVIAHTIIPMNIDFTIDRKLFIFWKKLRPKLSILFMGPIVFVESTPEDCSAVLVQILFSNNTVIKAQDIHNANGIVFFPAYRDGISTYNIHCFFVGKSFDGTLRFHNRNIYGKLGVNSLKQLLRFATLMQQDQERGEKI